MAEFTEHHCLKSVQYRLVFAAASITTAAWDQHPRSHHKEDTSMILHKGKGRVRTGNGLHLVLCPLPLDCH